MKASQKKEGQRTGREHQRYVKGDFHIFEFYRDHLADRQNKALSRQGDHAGRHLHADSAAHQQNPHDTEKHLLPVRGTGNSAHSPDSKIRQVAEQNCHGKLKKLNRIIASAQDQDLKSDEYAVHHDGRRPHRKRREHADHAGHAGNRRGSQIRLHGKSHAKGHHCQPGA